MALVSATELSLTRVQYVANDGYEIIKALQQCANGQINTSTALSLIKERVPKVAGAVIGTSLGVSAGAVIAATNFWNPFGWLVMLDAQLDGN